MEQGYRFEKIYHIHNPQTGEANWVSEREFQVGSQRMKDVFSILYLDDLKSMLRFNAQFQAAVMKENGIKHKEELSIQHVCRPIKKAEWMEFLKKEKDADNYDPSDYPARVELEDGCYYWNNETNRYEEVALVRRFFQPHAITCDFCFFIKKPPNPAVFLSLKIGKHVQPLLPLLLFHAPCQMGAQAVHKWSTASTVYFLY